MTNKEIDEFLKGSVSDLAKCPGYAAQLLNAIVAIMLLVGELVKRLPEIPIDTKPKT